MQVERVHSMADLPADALHWLRGQEARSIFAGAEWFAVFERTVASHLGTPEWLIIREPALGPVAVWPLIRNGRELGYMGNYYTPYAHLAAHPAKPGSEPPGLPDLLRAALRGSDSLAVYPLAPGAALLGVTRLSLLRHGLWRSCEVVSANWRAPVTDFDSYLAGRDSRVRNTLQRKQRALAREAEVAFRVATGGDGLAQAIADYQAIYAKSWKTDETFPHFISALIERAAERGWLALGILTVNNVPAAAQIWLISGGDAFIYKLAYDESFAKWSVGTQLTANMIEWVLTQRSVQRLDYLTGDDRYKREWMSERRPLYQVTIFNLLTLRGCLACLRSLARAGYRRLGHASHRAASSKSS